MKKLNLSLLIILVFISIIEFTSCKDLEVEHQHKFSEKWEMDEYYHWKKCSCGEIVFEATHSFGDWQIAKEPTEEAKGKQERKCTVCPYTVTEEIEKLAHTHKFSEVWTSDESGHWHVATCEHTEEISDKIAHIFGDWTVTQEATEEAEGSRERSCSVCGYTVTEEIEKLAHTHKFSEVWTSDESGHWHVATCGHEEEISGFAEHSFGIWNVIIAPTNTVKGMSNRICNVCNMEETKEMFMIPNDFVLIPAGTFQMGSNDGCDYNKPVHEVTITKPFYMGKYEVTQAEYEKYCSYGGSNSPDTYDCGNGDNYPVYYVSWYDALVYCNKRSMAEGLTPCYCISGNTDPSKWGTVPKSNDSTWDAVVCNWNANGYRLPTEAEWEYAARAGDNTVKYFIWSGMKYGNFIYDSYAVVDSSSTYEVGTLCPNEFGLYDMSGNVDEWCWNWCTDSYDITTEGGSDPTGALMGVMDSRVLRGGNWRDPADFAFVPLRSWDQPCWRTTQYGFRVVRTSSN